MHELVQNDDFQDVAFVRLKIEGQPPMHVGQR